jgi:hypothetical protein
MAKGLKKEKDYSEIPLYRRHDTALETLGSNTV